MCKFSGVKIGYRVRTTHRWFLARTSSSSNRPSRAKQQEVAIHFFALPSFSRWSADPIRNNMSIQVTINRACPPISELISGHWSQLVEKRPFAVKSPESACCWAQGTIWPTSLGWPSCPNHYAKCLALIFAALSSSHFKVEEKITYSLETLSNLYASGTLYWRQDISSHSPASQMCNPRPATLGPVFGSPVSISLAYLQSFFVSRPADPTG